MKAKKRGKAPPASKGVLRIGKLAPAPAAAPVMRQLELKLDAGPCEDSDLVELLELSIAMIRLGVDGVTSIDGRRGVLRLRRVP